MAFRNRLSVVSYKLTSRNVQLATYNLQLRLDLRPCSGSGGVLGNDRLLALVFAVGLLTGLADVDAALEECAVFDADALGHDVARQRSFVADVHAVAGAQVATHFSGHHDLTRRDVGIHNAVPSDRDPVAGQVDGALDASVDVKRFRSRDLALDDQRLSDRGLVLRVHGGVARGRRGRRFRRGCHGGGGGALRLWGRARSAWLIRGLPHGDTDPFVTRGVYVEVARSRPKHRVPSSKSFLLLAT